jgi:hypothetical protein
MTVGKIAVAVFTPTIMSSAIGAKAKDSDAVPLHPDVEGSLGLVAGTSVAYLPAPETTPDTGYAHRRELALRC